MHTSPILSSRAVVRTAAIIAFTAGMAGFTGGLAADVDLTGAWIGSGSVMFSGGSSEKARCRITYAKSGAVTYDVKATCATPSGKVDQTAHVKRSGPSTFSGSFYNADYDTTGNIQVSVNGNSQSVKLTSTRANASLRLSR